MTNQVWLTIQPRAGITEEPRSKVVKRYPRKDPPGRLRRPEPPGLREHLDQGDRRGGGRGPGPRPLLLQVEAPAGHPRALRSLQEDGRLHRGGNPRRDGGLRAPQTPTHYPPPPPPPPHPPHPPP